ncbi:hypothetical protein H6P81_008912 [Aristolochia fimbriata]|uniref:Uncharacterized protein n=1 Tax=Aristolochia fimbriata TaxID=158543 RepID=A0AAV7EMV8_ARIFI|nr:hypothetical protein H6P81_008912 [Aristolochia fimbriata]
MEGEEEQSSSADKYCKAAAPPDHIIQARPDEDPSDDGRTEDEKMEEFYALLKINARAAKHRRGGDSRDLDGKRRRLQDEKPVEMITESTSRSVPNYLENEALLCSPCRLFQSHDEEIIKEDQIGTPPPPPPPPSGTTSEKEDEGKDEIPGDGGRPAGS